MARCSGAKRSYASRAQAKAAARRFKSCGKGHTPAHILPGRLSPYLCKGCGAVGLFWGGVVA
jgi:hypothetical protein